MHRESWWIKILWIRKLEMYFNQDSELAGSEIKSKKRTRLRKLEFHLVNEDLLYDEKLLQRKFSLNIYWLILSFSKETIVGLNLIFSTVIRNEFFENSLALRTFIRVGEKLRYFSNLKLEILAISEEAERNVRLLSTGFDDRSRKKNGEAIVRDLLLSLEECYFGAVKKMVIGEVNRFTCRWNEKKTFDSLSFEQSSKVGNSKGNVREKILSITVKPGWMPGSRVTFSGAWDQNPNEKPSDVIFVIKDKPHPIFSRDKSDLIYKTQIDLGHALTGLVLHIPHIDGRKLDIPITEIVRWEHFPRSNKLTSSIVLFFLV